MVRRPGPPPSRGEAAKPSAYEQLDDLPADPGEWPLDEGEPPPPTRRGSSLPPFLVGLLVGVTLAVVSIVGFLLFRREPDGGTEQAVPPAAETTTTTTEAPATATTLALPTTSTTPAVTATTPAPIEATGDPIPLDDLRMASSGIGPLLMGADGNEILGRLTATFGQPNEDSGTFISSGVYGACPGDTVRVVRWGPLAVVITDPEGLPSFAGYRLDLAFGDLDSLSAELRTVSGLRAGDTVETLESIYADDFVINYVVDDDSGLVFELRNQDNTLLLWGPVTSADPDGKVGGIYSPNACAAPAG